MSLVFGPTFFDELTNAGLASLNVLSWSSDGTINGRELLTSEQNILLDQIIASHNPNKKRKNIIDFYIFISRFTDAEYTLLMQKRAQAINNNNVKLVKQWDIALSKGSLNLNSDDAENFKNALINANILTQPRADLIFN